MALSVPLSRSTLRFGGGSAFFVRQHDTSHYIMDSFCDSSFAVCHICYS